MTDFMQLGLIMIGLIIASMLSHLLSDGSNRMLEHTPAA